MVYQGGLWAVLQFNHHMNSQEAVTAPEYEFHDAEMMLNKDRAARAGNGASEKFNELFELCQGREETNQMGSRKVFLQQLLSSEQRYKENPPKDQLERESIKFTRNYFHSEPRLSQSGVCEEQLDHFQRQRTILERSMQKEESLQSRKDVYKD